MKSPYARFSKVPLAPSEMPTTKTVWYVIDNNSGTRLRGPYNHSETAGAIRREMETNASDGQNEAWNLWVVRCEVAEVNDGLAKTPTPPEGARYVRVGERISTHDMKWDHSASTWRPVPADLVGTELTPKQFHFFCRRVIP